MAITFNRKGVLYDLGVAALIIAFVAVLVSKPVIAPTLYTALLLLVVVAVCVLNTFREAHKEAMLDEMQLAAASFGARWAVTVPLSLMLLVLFVAPLQDGAVGFAQSIQAADGSAAPPILRVFVMGMVVAVILQLVGKSAISAIWTWRKR